MKIELAPTERDFIVDTALNGLWDYCNKRLSEENHLGDIEKRNLEDTIKETKRLMLKLDPLCLG